MRRLSVIRPTIELHRAFSCRILYRYAFSSTYSHFYDPPDQVWSGYMYHMRLRELHASTHLEAYRKHRVSDPVFVVIHAIFVMYSKGPSEAYLQLYAGLEQPLLWVSLSEHRLTFYVDMHPHGHHEIKPHLMSGCRTHIHVHRIIGRHFRCMSGTHAFYTCRWHVRAPRCILVRHLLTILNK